MSGTKRSNANSNNTPFDLKRRKAKVGKRALAPANVTDTSFRATSLHISKQDAVQKTALLEDRDGSLLMSSKGNRLSDLLAQLGHPAAAVRVAALKGMADVVASSGPNALRAHLSDLVPACAKSLVDEERDVRVAGLSVLRILFQGQSGILAFRPFVPLLAAYTTSALHSLDRSTRIDGMRVVQVLTTYLAPLLSTDASGETRVGGTVSKFLPSYASLVAERSLKATTQQEILQSLVSLLQTDVEPDASSLASSSQDSSNYSEDAAIDLAYIAGGSRASNCIMVDNPRINHRIRCISSIQELPSLSAVPPNEPLFLLSRNDAVSGAGQGPQNAKSNNQGEQSDEDFGDLLSAYYDLLSKLRDVLLESVEKDDFVDASSKSNAPMDMDRIVLISDAMRLLWLWIAPLCSSRSKKGRRSVSSGEFLSLSGVKCKVGIEGAMRHIQKLAQIQTLPLLLRIFPVSHDDARSSDHAKLDRLNASLCQTIMELSSPLALPTPLLPSHLGSDDGSPGTTLTSCIDPLCSYLVPYLSKFRPSRLKDKPRASQVTSPSPMIISVYRRLLLLQYDNLCVGRDEKERDTSDDDRGNDTVSEASMSHFLSIRKSMLFQLESVFFDPEISKEERAEVLRSTAGRQAALLVREVLEREGYCVSSKSSPAPGLPSSLLSSLIGCIVSWEEDFLFESMCVLRALLEVVRRLNTDELQSGKDLGLGDIQDTLSTILIATKKNGRGPKRSIFERWPGEHQRLFVSILALLGSPCESMLSDLSSVCSRSCARMPSPIISSALVDFVFECLYDVRTTISVSRYLQFMIASSGIDLSLKQARKRDAENRDGGADSKSLVRDAASGSMLTDNSLRRLCLFFVRCGTQRILPMLLPLLSSWLSGYGLDSFSGSTSKSLPSVSFGLAIRLRAACIVVAMCSLDLRRQCGQEEQDETTSSAVFELSTMENLLQPLSSGLLLLLSCSPILKNDAAQHATWMRPLLCLLSSEPCLIGPVFARASNLITSASVDGDVVLGILQSLTDVAQDQSAGSALSRVESGSNFSVRSCCDSMLLALGDGPVGQAASQLCSVVRALCVPT